MDVQTSVIGIDTLVGTAVSQTLIDSEIPLPEGRVAASVLCAGTQVGACTAETLQDAVRVSGNLTLLLLCESPSGEAFGFSAASTFVHNVELAGAAEGMAASASAQVMECRCETEAGKLHLTAILELSAQVTAPVTEPFVTDVTGAAGLEARFETVCCRRVAPPVVHSIRIREEISAPTAAQVLLCHGAAQVRELVYNGDTATVDGSLYVTVLTASEDGELAQQTQIIPFTDVFDAPYAPTAWAIASLEQLGAVAADMSFGVADVEAVVEIRIYALEQSESRVLCDAYDEGATFTCTQRRLEQLLCTGAEQKRFAFREGVQIPAHLPEAYRTVYVTATPAVTGTFEQDGRLGVDVMVFVTALYRCDGGQLHSFPYDLPLQLSMDAPYTPDARIEVQVLSAQLTGSGRTPELLLTLEARAILCTRQPLCLAAGVEPGGETAAPRGIVIYCTGAGETLWEVGKRFRVTLPRLREWNTAVPEGQAPDTALEEGTRLVLLC